MTPRFLSRLLFTAAIVTVLPLSAAAQDRLCDPANEDCRAILISYIRNETVAIDVAFWFMEDARYTNELIERFQAGVQVRVLVDTRANSSYPLNAQRLAELKAAGIPMRRRLTSDILHWKMMLFHSQNVVEFSGANYSPDAFRPGSPTPYENYVDEAIYFTSDTPIVNSFRTRFDDQWVDTDDWTNYANVTTLSRRYGIYPTDPSLNFVPWENYRSRAIANYNAEQRAIDAIMYRITDRSHADAMLAAVGRGVQVRLITEPAQYRDPARMWHAWNVDRMYMGGVDIKHRAHQGLNHQKSVILYDQNGAAGDQPLVIFGSSNWSSPSATGQVEHNMFTTKPHMISWFVTQFERKWNNSSGVAETVPFGPLPPDPPVNPVPAAGATNVSTSVRLTWNGGPWAHLYDVYLDTNPYPVTLVASNLAESSSKTETSSFSYTHSVVLRTGTTYYWRVVGKTMALRGKSSEVWSFTTSGPRACVSDSGDFDGDCRADFAVFRPSSGEWFLRYSRSGSGATVQWGRSGDIPVPGDYDGDRKQDLAVYRPSNGTWYLRYSSTGNGTSVQWGASTDIPVPGDYDGDRRTDLAVFRPATGMWYVRYARNGAGTSVPFGAPGDVPVAADYDGDDRTDFAVFRPSTGIWWLRYSSTGGVAAVQWGQIGDVAAPGDYDGDRRADVAVFRPSNGTWYVRYTASGAAFGLEWGGPADQPAPGDYDGDGRTDLAVFRPSTGVWYLRYSSSGAGTALQWGNIGDVPVIGR